MRGERAGHDPIDPLTGQGALAVPADGAFGGFDEVESVEAGPDGTLLVVGNANELFEVDPGPRTVRRLGPVAGVARVEALAYAGGVWYAAASLDDDNAETLVRLDPASRTAAAVGPFGTPFDVDGLAAGPDGALYAAHIARGQHGLYRVDPATGKATLVREQERRLLGLDFTPGGTLYGVEVPISGGSVPSTLVTIDPANGDIRAVGPTGFSFVTGLAAVAARVDTDPANYAPAFNRPLAAAELAATAGAAYRLAPRVLDPDGDPLAFDLVSAPAGMAVHPALGIVVWTPAADQLGEHSAVLRAKDDKGNVTLLPFAVTVAPPNTPPAVTSAPPPGPAAVGKPFVYRVAARDADGDDITYALENAPDGVAVDSDGLVTWTPTAAQAGGRTFVVVAKDNNGGVSRQTVALSVRSDAPNAAPVIASAPRTTAWLGRVYAYEVKATDANADPLTYTLVARPDGMAVDAAGLVTWDPADAALGPHAVELRVEDGRGGAATQAFTVTVGVREANAAPAVTSVPRPTATVGRPYRLDLAAADPDGDPVRYALVSGPRGMTVDPASGALAWTPAADQLGPQRVVVRAEDLLTAAGTQEFTVAVACVNQPPAVTSQPPTAGSVGEPYVYAVRGDDPDGDALTFTLVARPAGMTIDEATGVVRWTPGVGDTGPQAVVVQADDGNGNLATQSFAVAVTATTPNRPPVITSRPRTRATAGRGYTYAVTARDPDGDALEFVLLDKPDGLGIDKSSGVITWTPSAAGTPTVLVAAIDPARNRAVQTFVLKASVNEAPVITSEPVNAAVVGAPYRYDLRAADPNGDPLTYRVVTGPPGLAIDPVGRVTWTPADTDRGDKTVLLEVADDSGLTATQRYTVTAGADAERPAVTVVLSRTLVRAGGTVRVSVRATDNVGVTGLTLTADGVPVALDANNEATFPTAGADRVTFAATATDRAGNAGTGAADLLVVDPALQGQVTADLTRLELHTAPGRFTRLDPRQAVPDLPYLTDVYGTVASTGNPVAAWTLLAARADQVDLDYLDATSPAWRKLGSGTSAVTDGKLGTFDPTLLTNDRYVLAVVAYDVLGQGVIQGYEVNVVGAAKLGEFRLQFTDLSVPLAGIPVEVTRVYDTRDAGEAKDFGYGWTLGVRDARVRESVAQGGDGFFTTGAPFKPGTKVYLTNPRGERVGFTFRPEAQGVLPSGALNLFGVSFPRFVPDPGVTDKLEAVDNIALRQGSDGGYHWFLFGIGYNPDGYRLTTADGMAYDYDQFAGLQRVADLNGNTLTFGPGGVTHSSGVKIAFDRDGLGRVTAIRLPGEAGQAGPVAVRYRYDAKGDLVEVKQVTEHAPAERTIDSTFTYRADRPHYLDEYFDPNGKRAVKTGYDPATGRVIAVIGPDGSRAEQDFDPLNFAETVKDKRGNPTVLTYNDRGNVTKTVQPTESGDIVTQFFYDDPANPDKETKVFNGRGFATTKTYDARGNQLTETSADGTTTYRYNAQNKLTYVADPLGRTTAYDYSPAGNLVRVVNPLGDDSAFTYDAGGRVATFEDFAGNVTTFRDYHPSGRPQTVENPDKTTRSVAYNAYAQVTQVTDEVGNVTRNFYDALGRLVKVLDGEQVGNPASLGTRYEYEGANQVRVIDPLNNVTKYGYDDGGRKTRIIDAEGGVTQFTYDKNGNLETVTDPVNNVTTFKYDKANRLTEEIDPLLKSRFFAYDPAGNKTKATDRNGKVRTFEYDPLNRVRTATTVYPGTAVPAVTLTHGYDANGNRTSVVDNTGVRVDSVYGDRNELESRTWQGGGIDAAKVAFDYYANGERKSLDRYADTAKIGSTAYDYWKNGLSKTITHRNGAGDVLVGYGYQYDDAHRLSQETHHGQSYVYVYDKTGQLRTVAIDGKLTESFTYDANGNRRTSTGPNGDQTYAPAGKGNQLLRAC